MERKLKVCVIHRYPAKEVLGTNPSFVKLLEDLVEKGHDVSLVTLKDDQKINGVKYVKYVDIIITILIQYLLI